MLRFAPLLFALFPLTAFAQTISVYGSGGQSPETRHGQAHVQALHLEYARPLSPRYDVAFVLSPTSYDQPKSWFGDDYGDGNERVNALLGSLLLRRTWNRDSSRVHIFGEVSTGPMYAQKAVPASTSRFNFVSQAGAGVELLPQSRFPVIAGYRFQHVSNGGYAPRNPGLNFSALYVGFRIATTRPR